MTHMRTQFATFLVLALAVHGSSAQPAANVAAAPQFDARVAVLARQVEAAEALRAIRRLQWAYGHYSEFGLWHDFADLFADSGVGHYVQGDLDREGIRALFLEQVGQGRLGLADGRIYPHISFSPVLTLADDGLHAQARFRILGMLGGYGGNASWFHGLYENAYVKEGGTWKLNELTNGAQITGNFTEGLAAADAAPLPPHFTPESVGSIVLPQVAGARPLAELQQRLRRVEDEDFITQLQHQFGYYYDNHDWDRLAELFAEQGTLELGRQGVYVGKASIRKALEQFGPLQAGQVDDHILFQAYISVAPDGASAAARVDQLGMQGTRGGSAQWTQGIYENTFVKEDGIWRIRSIHYYPRLVTDHARGWAVDAQPAPEANAAYPADAPPTENVATYPAFYLPAFHFAHPVTGAAPQYPEGTAARPPAFAPAPLPPPPALGVTEAALAMNELLARRTLGRDAVENLVNAFAYYLDACMTAEAAALFAAQGAVDIPGSGRYAGAQIAPALRSLYCADPASGVRTQRHTLQPVFNVTAYGQSAGIKTRVWEVSAEPGAADAYASSLWWATAVPVDGQGWKLSELRLEKRWRASVEDGWAAPSTSFYLDSTQPP